MPVPSDPQVPVGPQEKQAEIFSMWHSILDKKQEFLEILDEIKRDIDRLPLEEKKYYSSWEKKARQTFLNLFRTAIELGDAVADLYMLAAFSQYELIHACGHLAEMENPSAAPQPLSDCFLLENQPFPPGTEESPLPNKKNGSPPA